MSPLVIVRLVVLVATGASCNQVFDLAPTQPAPDANLDGDGDGVADVADNCPRDANPSQADEDQDGIGDVCDNCPLVANTAQDVTGDDDLVGDLCDPHPDVPGDCLVLFDSFTQPAAFASHWTVRADPGATPMITPGEGAVSVDPRSARAMLIATDDAGVVIDGLFDVQLAGRVQLRQGSLVAVSSTASAVGGYGCGISGSPLTRVEASAAANDGNGSSLGTPLSPQPVGDAVLLRLIASGALASTRIVECRGDYGYGLALSSHTPVSRPTGGPGIAVRYDPAELHSIAVYRFQPGVACAPPLMR